MTHWKHNALEHALKDAPREACGLVVVIKGREQYWPCKNLAPAQDFFILDPDDYAAAEDAGDVIAVFHSHPQTPAQPSQADRMACEKSGLVWHICNPGTEMWCKIEPEGYQAPLIGREWVWGVSDCWTLVRDWYKEEMGLELPDWERPASLLEFHGAPMFERCFADAGFEDHGINEPEHGDLIFMQLNGSPGLNHVAVYVGEQRILHHLRGRLSSRDIWGGYYQKNTGLIVRHGSRC
jgi:proteasome lid subunit RPN8/RPN11